MHIMVGNSFAIVN